MSCRSSGGRDNSDVEDGIYGQKTARFNVFALIDGEVLEVLGWD
jgi:hypothetical protein